MAHSDGIMQHLIRIKRRIPQQFALIVHIFDTNETEELEDIFEQKFGVKRLEIGSASSLIYSEDKEPH